MKLSDFQFDLPAHLIAQTPPAERSGARLLAFGGGVAPSDRHITDLPALLQPGDLMVFNNTAVIKARVRGHKADSGGRVEVLVERILPSEAQVLCQIGASKPVRAGARLRLEGAVEATVEDREGAFFRLSVDAPDVFAWLDAHGEIPLPPYIARPPDRVDAARYQTVFASQPGAVAAPTAGLHFDDALLSALDARGVSRAEITLHVGAGTFQPVRVEHIAEHRMHPEWLSVDNTVVAAVEACRARGGRVIAVGTTTVRALETAARANAGTLARYHGDSHLFLTPGEPFHVIDGLITNFHLPGSTLLMLISAFTGLDTVRAAYAHAVAGEYRFFSYGDACLIWPSRA
ncbi:MAG: tRNA preQ1(34) S-adenosylmethionine ribosyltransferase-isomerase QueA [Pseudomonadota bacterium]